MNVIFFPGAVPYTKVDNKFILTYLKSGRRLKRPEICTDELFEIMKRCWCQNPDERPSFSELVNLLDHRNKRIYVKFTTIASNYVFPPIVSND